MASGIRIAAELISGRVRVAPLRTGSFGLLACCVVVLASVGPVRAAGKYTLAFWREVGAYENQAPPAGEFGNHSAFVHVWDEAGQPLPGRAIYTSWGVLLGATDANGFVEIELRRPNGYDFQVRDGAQSSDTTPVLSVERPPTWGHYSFEIGFVFKQNAANPGVFDTSVLGKINASGDDPCMDLSAPHTRSLAFYSTAASNYCSDAYALGNWAASHGQSFVATGNRIVALKALMAAGFGVHHFWTAQILEGGPNGTPIGPPRTTRLHLDSEYYPLLIKWGANDVQVVPGRVYYLRITRDNGINVFRVNRNNFTAGNYFEDGSPEAGAEMMGLVVCGTYTNAGPVGTLAGYVRNALDTAIGGAIVLIPDTGLYTTTAADGRYFLPSVPTGTFQVTVSKFGYATGVRSDVPIASGQVTVIDFSLDPDETQGGGVILSPSYSFQPFEASPAWNSTFDAEWGSAATFAVVSGGQQGNALQATRGGPGSSVRVQKFPVRTNTPYELSVWMRCPSSASDYWVETGFRLGAHPAESFDSNAGAWTLVQKFTDNGPNGNGNAWTRYAVNFNSGSAAEVTVGFKVGSLSGPGPTVSWDELALVSWALPGIHTALAESSSNIVVRMDEAFQEEGATNAANYSVTGTSGTLAVTGILLNPARDLVLTTEPQWPGVDYTVTISNVTALFQPSGLTGRNGQVVVRVPIPILGMNDDGWRYHDRGGFVAGSWRSVGFEDSSWPSGAGLLGYADGPLPHPIETPLTVNTNRITVFFRKQLSGPVGVSNVLVRLRAIVDDGAVFWLNGVEWFRVGITNNPAFYFTPATRVVGLAELEGPFDLSAPSWNPGTNLLAVEVHQAAAASSDTVFGASLELLLPPSQVPSPPPMLSISRDGDWVIVAWSDPAASLESSTNALGPWWPFPAESSTAALLATNRMQFFRLTR